MTAGFVAELSPLLRGAARAAGDLASALGVAGRARRSLAGAGFDAFYFCFLVLDFFLLLLSLFLF